MSTNHRGRLHHSLRSDGSDDLLFKIDSNCYRLYEPDSDPPPIGTKTSNTQGQSPSKVGDSSRICAPAKHRNEFAYEQDLRNYLANNLSLLEAGLSLFIDGNIRGVEYPVGKRRVDLLAQDSSNNYVVIELKVSRGYDRTVGQLLRYMNWIRKHRANNGQAVRGMIIARNIDDDLRLACEGLEGVQLFEYDLAVTVTRV